MATGILAALLLTGQNTPIQRYAYTEIHMGVEFRLTFYADGPEQADAAAKDAYERIEELEQAMSDYRPSSEVRQIKPLEETRVSDDLWIVLEQAQEISRQTDGAFDVTAGPAVKLWRMARQSGRMPGPIELRQAVALVGFRNLRLNPETHTVTILKAGVAIDLGGIAKGYACDAAIDKLARHGITRAIVQSGGDIATADAPPDAEGWPILIPGEETPRLLKKCAVSTSGDTEQFIELDGVRYSHIVDPRTGMGVTNCVMATIIADRGLVSDPLATAYCVMGKGGLFDIRGHDGRLDPRVQ